MLPGLKGYTGILVSLLLIATGIAAGMFLGYIVTNFIGSVTVQTTLTASTAVAYRDPSSPRCVIVEISLSKYGRDPIEDIDVELYYNGRRIQTQCLNCDGILQAPLGENDILTLYVYGISSGFQEGDEIVAYITYTIRGTEKTTSITATVK